MVSIFSKSPIDLKSRVIDEAKATGDADLKEEMIEVIDPATVRSNDQGHDRESMVEATEKISASDPSYYSASGLKARKYHGSSKPLDIPSFVWQSMSVKARRDAIAKEQKKIAQQEAEKKRKSRAAVSLEKLEIGDSRVAPVINRFHDQMSTHAGRPAEEDIYPKMPTCNYDQQRHRIKCCSVALVSREKATNILVARPVNRKEIRSNPKAQESLDVEWQKLIKKTAWLFDTVTEWGEVAGKAKKSGKKVHVGKVFEICVEKGSELPEGHKLGKFKGRTVFQGNNVRDENADVARHYSPSWDLPQLQWKPGRPLMLMVHNRDTYVRLMTEFKPTLKN